MCPDGGVIRRGDYLELVQKLLANVADASVPRIGLAVFETTFERRDPEWFDHRSAGHAYWAPALRPPIPEASGP